MIHPIIFSRDRPAQLELLLYSLAVRTGSIFAPASVLFLATNTDFERGYKIVQDGYPRVEWCRETDFPKQVRNLLRDTGEFMTFFTDDDVVVRPMISDEAPPEELLESELIACVSLRLGRNTTNCYPLRRTQRVPDSLVWPWGGADGDFGYPASLDGHVFRARDMQRLVDSEEFANPNELESAISVKAHQAGWLPPAMACYEQSLICGVPVNRVNETHPNRFGEVMSLDLAEANDLFLSGRRLLLPDVIPNGAHMEINLEFTEGDV